ncbi:MAG: bifunctional acetate--CoA ligase family protein/GNAT family N-acetyltransferase [Burkholderiales bacterium]|nr:bifunctional acetate--CoA ligase family protein/GNAT family N-acetyltransferase [Phycisphaerae bacterium]
MQSTETVHDVLRHERQPLDSIFAPTSVALIGATETANSVGRTLLWNLMSNPFGGTIYPVNPKRSSVLGIPAYASIKDVPQQVDLAVIVTPAAAVPGIVGQCADAGVKGAIVISAGFKEQGAPGAALETQLLAEARRGRMRIIGPNCLGVMNPLSGLNATFAKGMAKPGRVAFISQSGALCTAVLDWSLRERVGFSAFVSIGSMLDIGWGDLIDYLGNDPRTQAILIYMESIGDARGFLSAAREVALNKPIIVIKPGRSEAAARAAASHTGAMTGSDEVLDAAFKRVGVLRVNNIAELFYMAEVLNKQPRPRGNRLTIVTNAGGPGVLATDALIGNGGALTSLSQQTVQQLNSFLPPAWSHNNPIDVLGDAGADRYAKTLEIAAKDENSDGLLVVLTPQDMTESTKTADLLKQYAQIDGKPVLASWMGGTDVAAGEAILNAAGIPTFPYPDTAARMFCHMHKYAKNLRLLYETPSMDSEIEPDDALAAAIINTALSAGRTLLDEYESKRLLTAYGIQVAPTFVAATPDDAVARAAEVGYPCVLKLHSHIVTHKTDVGGVKLNLQSADEVRMAFDVIKANVARAHPSSLEAANGTARLESDDVLLRSALPHGEMGEVFLGVTVQPMVKMADAYELILGSSIDPQFGPVLLFGMGGQLVEVFKDRSLGLPPLNATLAKRMMEQTRIYTALQGVRGRPPVNIEQLASILVRFSRLVTCQPRIAELDINPLLVSHRGMIALDARVVLHPPAVTDAALPRTAIRPYPSQYVTPLRLKNGQDLTIRPIRPEDEPLMVNFHEQLSERSVRLRYFHTMKLSQRTSHGRLTRVCFNDYDRELALVVERIDADHTHHILGVGRLSRMPGLNEAEFAVLIADADQGKGIGSALLERIVEVARSERIGVLRADILNDNFGMQRLCQRLGFAFTRQDADGTMIAELRL